MTPLVGKVRVIHPLIPAAVLLGTMIFSNFGTLRVLAFEWVHNDDFSYGMVVVAIAVGLAWRKRSDLGRVAVAPDWRGVIVMAVGLAGSLIGELGAELFTVRASMIITFIGAFWLLYGSPVVRILRFSLVFLFLMLPLPGLVYRNITFPLQLLSSKWSVAVLHWMGIGAVREGNVIDLGSTQLQVAEACNGLRFILPLLALGVLFAFLGRHGLGRRLIVVAAAVPFAILANILRISGTGIISVLGSPEAATGFFHFFSGWVVFVISLCGYAIMLRLLCLLPAEKALPAELRLQSTAAPVCRAYRIAWWPLALASFLVLAAPWAIERWARVPPKTLKMSLATFPKQFGDYSGVASEMDGRIWDRVGGQHYVIIDYLKHPFPPVNFYTAYYEHQRMAGDFIHSPKLCLPGAGWFVEQNRKRTVAIAPCETGLGAKLRFNEMLVSNEGQRQLVYYWYQGRDRNITSEYVAKFFLVWDGLWRRRSDGALVRLMLPLTGIDVTEGRRVLDPFAQFVSLQLTDYLP
ncbi:MAG: hypothetical protein VR64_11520 [Desulfatitalea sp. BRH_c12]|nr:MAG: hypothetical protein VR64_11520 [Desulfatitalea sp. BRH_c12]